MAGDKKPDKKLDRKTERKEDTLVREREATKTPRRHKVLMHNDDFTPMEFVTHVLEEVFHRTPAEATRIMLLVHRTGLGIAGVYSHEVAESKAMTTIRLARDSGYPLLVTTEPE